MTLNPPSKLPSNPLRHTPRLDWGDALAVPTFYGREAEMRLLTEWIVNERCRVVSVIGLGGAGKSALAVRVMQAVASQFEVVIWRSLRDAPAVEALLDDLLQVLAPQRLAEAASSLDRRITVLMEQLRATCVLLVLDNLESILEDGEGGARMHSGYEGYGRLLRRVAETEHQSSLVLTSREKPGVLIPLEGHRSPIRTLRLARLDTDACEQLLAEKGVEGSAAERAQLMEAYAGNPLALKIVAETIVDLFGGAMGPFLKLGEVIFGGIRELLAGHFNRLSALEQTMLVWLAIAREPVTLDDLAAALVIPEPHVRLFEAVEALLRRSLIERGSHKGSFTLQSVVMEYVTGWLIDGLSEEIRQGKPTYLLQFGLEQADAPNYIRQAQTRLLVAPVLAQLPQAKADMEALLTSLLEALRTRPEDAQGYGPANVVALLRLHRGSLREVDLSGLFLRGGYLQGVEMQDASLVGARIQDSIFTDSFDAMLAVSISSNGAYWAAASRHGEVRVWEGSGLILLHAWQTHSDMVWTLEFSPDERTLASGSWDGTVKLRDLTSGALLWTVRHSSLVKWVAFSPDGTMLASSGNDGVVQIWDVKNGARLGVLEHTVPVPAVTWSPDGSLLVTGDREGLIRLWEIQKTGIASLMRSLSGHINWIDGLAFSPDGAMLSSAGWDGTVRLWETASGRLLREMTGHTDWVLRMAWSPDGRTLASGGRDHTILLWDIEQGSSRAALLGHAAEVVGIAFMPDSRRLLSGSEDGTLRVWNVADGQCIRVIQGWAASLYDVDWSPDGTQLVSAGADGLVTLYTMAGENPPRVLRGHSGVVFGVGWSSTGHWLASSEWNNVIRLWDPASGSGLQLLEYPEDAGNVFYSLAWSPDGTRLACGTHRQGVQMFEMTSPVRHWAAEHVSPWIRQVDWRPDGAQFGGGGDDGIVYVWDAGSGALLQSLAGHHNMVRCIAWSPDGSWMVSGSGSIEGGELFLWDVQHGECAYRFVGHPGIVYSVAWSPYGDMVISGGSDGKLRWWDVQTGRLLWERETHQGTIHALRRSPDGTMLASTGDDGAIWLWELSSGDYIRTLRRDRPYERLNITAIRGLTEAQKAILRTLGAVGSDGV